MNGTTNDRLCIMSSPGCSDFNKVQICNTTVRRTKKKKLDTVNLSEYIKDVRLCIHKKIEICTLYPFEKRMVVNAVSCQHIFDTIFKILSY